LKAERFVAAWIAAFLAAPVVGCNLVSSNTFSVPYSFSPISYEDKFGDANGTVPAIMCDPGNANSCAAVQIPPGSSLMAVCDDKAKSCAATAELRLSYPVDLTMENLPSEAIMYGINFVSIGKVEYWSSNDTLNFNTPLIDIYVAPMTAQDETGGTKLGSIGPIMPGGTPTCSDTHDTDSAAGMSMVCDMPLDSDGENALANFVKDYKTPFQFFAHTTVSAMAGEPLPAGTLDFTVRPVISIGILK
jgi:hypothetical protein